MEIKFWLETKADGILYPGIVHDVLLPEPTEGAERILVVRFPEEVMKRTDLEIVLQLGKANLLITGKDKEDKDNTDKDS